MAYNRVSNGGLSLVNYGHDNEPSNFNNVFIDKSISSKNAQ